MSVIAKMNVLATRDFGTGALIELSCVCANDLMAAYAESHEDKLFTQYSPWGEARVQLFAGHRIPFEGDQFYLVAMRKDECRGQPMSGASYLVPARCASLTHFADGQDKRVEFQLGWRKETVAVHASGFNWKMSVNNPGALCQFVPGTDDYWIGFYPVSKFDRNEAIADAHGPAPELSPAAVAVEVEA